MRIMIGGKSRRRKRLTFSVSLPLNDRAHENLDWPNILEWYLALSPVSILADRLNRLDNTNLSSSLIQAQVVSEFLLAHGARRINFIPEDKEWDL